MRLWLDSAADTHTHTLLEKHTTDVHDYK